MKTTRFMIGAGLLAVALAPPLSAHHSFAAEFDINKPVTLTGTVTKLEWTNPHIWVYLDVKDDQGNLQHWQCEGGPPNTLTRNGWGKDSLKPSDQITVDGVLAKDVQRAPGQASGWPQRLCGILGRRQSPAPKVTQAIRRDLL
jgi:hypothetical protein